MNLFRARRLSATLHPTVPIHAPLVFDLIDRWQNRSIAQCTYHVVPPDGRIYPSRPANAAEAEERRNERFLITAPSLAPVVVQEDGSNAIFPMTLDLRRVLPPTPSSGATPEAVS